MMSGELLSICGRSAFEIGFPSARGKRTSAFSATGFPGRVFSALFDIGLPVLGTSEDQSGTASPPF